ncbi:hypothetical protein GQ55_3G098400 [Panicum hallii var. hallii]|uniref:Uncharacterized protein n=1 Tax=Panicum hallii var. hallii TaxID=1504633 RepID=A0A2T7E7Q5_9POAL|nr:hypothetical protein GQ55_3G098400 [Panicum hallii var. hallii]
MLLTFFLSDHAIMVRSCSTSSIRRQHKAHRAIAVSKATEQASHDRSEETRSGTKGAG